MRHSAIYREHQKDQAADVVQQRNHQLHPCKRTPITGNLWATSCRCWWPISIQLLFSIKPKELIDKTTDIRVRGNHRSKVTCIHVSSVWRSRDILGDVIAGGMGCISFGTTTRSLPKTKIAPALFAVPVQKNMF